MPNQRAGSDNLGGASQLAAEYRSATETTRELLIQRCADCATRYFPPQLKCRSCGSRRLKWEGCGTKGTVQTWVTVHGQAETPSMSVPRRLSERTPYSTVFLAPDDAPEVRIASLYFPKPDSEPLMAGQRMTIGLEEMEGRLLPVCIPDHDHV